MKTKFDIFLIHNKIIVSTLSIILIAIGMTLVSFGTYASWLAYLGLLLFIPGITVMLFLLLLLLYKI